MALISKTPLAWRSSHLELEMIDVQISNHACFKVKEPWVRVLHKAICMCCLGCWPTNGGRAGLLLIWLLQCYARMKTELGKYELPCWICLLKGPPEYTATVRSGKLSLSCYWELCLIHLKMPATSFVQRASPKHSTELQNEKNKQRCFPKLQPSDFKPCSNSQSWNKSHSLGTNC